MNRYEVKPKNNGPIEYFKALCLWTAKLKAKRMNRRLGWGGFKIARVDG